MLAEWESELVHPSKASLFTKSLIQARELHAAARFAITVASFDYAEINPEDQTFKLPITQVILLR